MTKAKSGLIKNLHYLCLMGVIALGLMTIVGTSGGGGGGDTTTTTGDTTTPTTDDGGEECVSDASYISIQYPNLSALRTVGNKLVDAECNALKLRGVCLLTA